MASVTIDQVQKYFGQTHIIKGVSIDIADGVNGCQEAHFSGF